MHLSGELNIGNIIAAIAVIITIVTLHRQNIRTIIKAAEDLTEIKTKVNTMWDYYLKSINY